MIRIGLEVDRPRYHPQIVALILQKLFSAE